MSRDRTLVKQISNAETVKILQIHCEHREAGGEDVVVERDHEVLHRAGHVVLRVGGHNPTSPWGAAIALGQSPWNVSSAHHIRKIATRFQPDVVHIHNTWFRVSPAVIGALADFSAPIVVSIHNFRTSCINGLLLRNGNVCENCVGRRIPLDGVRFRCYRGSTIASVLAASTSITTKRMYIDRDVVSRFVVLTDFAKEKLVEAGIPDRKIVVNPNSVPAGPPRAIKAAESNSYLFVGRLSQEKGIQVLIDAWRIVDPSMELKVCGDGPLKEDLIRSAPKNVQFLGRCQAAEVRLLISQARALLMPSIWYEGGLPLVALEAFAGALPVITTDLGGRRTLVNGAGTTINGLDAGAWSRAINQIQDRDLEAWSAQALVRWQSTYSDLNMLQRLEGIYEGAMSGEPS